MLEARELVLRQRFEVIINEAGETRDMLLKVNFDPGDEDQAAKPGAEPGDREQVADGDAQRAARVSQAVLRMKKLDIAELQRAYDGK